MTTVKTRRDIGMVLRISAGGMRWVLTRGCCWRELKSMFRWRPQLRDLLLLRRYQRVELRDLAGVLALLVLAEQEQIGDVLRPPAEEIQLVLRQDRLPQLLELLRVGRHPERRPGFGPLGGRCRHQCLAV